ncbi:hypothetical protein ACLOJK_015792 [Asimina triloba]
MEKVIPFTGILSNKAEENPGVLDLIRCLFLCEKPVVEPSSLLNFYNWNRVMIHYCNGASFMGEGESQRFLERGHNDAAATRLCRRLLRLLGTGTIT